MSSEVTVIIPTPFREYTGGKSEITIEGGTVERVFNNLGETYPELREQVVEEDGRIKDFINVYKNDQDIRHEEELETEVNDGDELSIIPAIAGGRPIASSQ